MIEYGDLETDMLKGTIGMKRMLITFCLLFCCSIVTACGNRADKNGSKISDDGRSYGGLIKGETGEAVETAFFDVTVKEAVPKYASSDEKQFAVSGLIQGYFYQLMDMIEDYGDYIDVEEVEKPI